ncbi:MAG: hypothetical protein HLUCCA08_01920 [Rhodobacteraceae bacterium HLUCCA08]|nr:MAG: hypothetical protein HLUCCA08_01920 [Rhodobacteraceae bacterium HLUCCA08]
MRHLAILGALVALSALSACGNPLGDMNRLSEVDVDDAAAAIVAAELSGDAALVDQLTAGEQATAAAATAAAPDPEPRRGLLGLFGGRRDAPALASSDAPAASDTVPMGTALPFGEIARVCDVRRGDLGREVISAEGYRVHDTIPAATDPRIFYVTGFKDRCARTFTATVVLESDAATHEFVRYASGIDAPYSAPDEAYEEIKSRICRVRRGQPCGDRIGRLSDRLQFLTLYDSFGGSPDEWVEILLHDGAVAAIGWQRL